MNVQNSLEIVAALKHLKSLHGVILLLTEHTSKYPTEGRQLLNKTLDVLRFNVQKYHDSLNGILTSEPQVLTDEAEVAILYVSMTREESGKKFLSLESLVRSYLYAKAIILDTPYPTYGKLGDSCSLKDTTDWVTGISKELGVDFISVWDGNNSKILCLDDTTLMKRVNSLDDVI